MKYQKNPTTLNVDGIAYGISTDFRTWIDFSTFMNKSEEETDTLKNILLFVEKLKLPLKSESVVEVLQFYNCGEKIEKTEKSGKSEKKKKNTAFDFLKDEELIVSAFRSQYNIDLRNIEYLHWWDFLALFKGIKDDETISKIMEYRTVDLSQLPESSRKQYRKLKEKYSLDTVRYNSLAERDKAMINKIKELQRTVNGNG